MLLAAFSVRGTQDRERRYPLAGGQDVEQRQQIQKLKRALPPSPGDAAHWVISPHFPLWFLSKSEGPHCQPAFLGLIYLLKWPRARVSCLLGAMAHKLDHLDHVIIF